MKSPTEIINLMMGEDAFSQWLSVSILDIDAGKAVLKCLITKEMLNGFKIAHGGISYSLADSAMAFAANAHGYQCKSIETSISHTKACKLGDEIYAYASELHRGRTVGNYQVILKNQDKETIGLFKGIVFITDNVW